MHPIAKAYRLWKKTNPKGSMRTFATFIGYADPDPLYRLIRGDRRLSYERAEKIAPILGWTPGRLMDEVARHRSKAA